MASRWPDGAAGRERRWIKTTPIRIYGPEQAAFDGSWKPADFEEVK